MSNAFEDAMHQEFSAEEMADEMEEMMRDYESNMPCDNSGFCAGTSCPIYFKCKGGTT